MVTLLRSKDGSARISASIKHKYPVAGLAALAPSQQAWHLPVQPGSRDGLCSSETTGNFAARALTMTGALAVAAEHQLGLCVTTLCRGTEPARRGDKAAGNGIRPELLSEVFPDAVVQLVESVPQTWLDRHLENANSSQLSLVEHSLPCRRGQFFQRFPKAQPSQLY